MIKTIIIDDDPLNIKVLKRLIAEFCPDLTITGEADNAQTGEALIRKKQPELVFLDIEMPYGNGFDMLQALMPVEFEVIFVTAFNSYLQQAFKFSALDYLLKPVNIEDLKDAVAKAQRRIKNSATTQLALLLENLKQPNPGFQKIAIPINDGYTLVRITDIIRCEANRAYTEIHIAGRKGKVLVSKPLKEYEALLPAELFFRVHNSHIININFIKRYNKGRGGFIELEDGFTVEVAARRKEEFLKKLGVSG